MKNKALFLTVLMLISFSCANNPNKQTPEQKKAEVYYNQGTTELVAKNYSQALSHLIKAKELNSKDTKIRNNLGMAYYFKEQLPLAQQELEAAISLDKTNSEARMNLGALFMSKGMTKEARAQFEKVLQDLTYSNQFRNYYNLAVLSLKEGDRKEAIEFLIKSIKEQDEYCPSHFKLGELYSEEFRFTQALESFKKATQNTCVNDPAPHYQQALTLVNLNRPTEAKLKFQEITEKFASTRYRALAEVQIKKILNSYEQQSTRVLQTERINESNSVETPNF